MSANTKQDMHLDDASKIALEAMDAIERGLANFGVTLTDEQEDKIFVPVLEFLERLSNGNYRHDH